MFGALNNKIDEGLILLQNKIESKTQNKEKEKCQQVEKCFVKEEKEAKNESEAIKK